MLQHDQNLDSLRKEDEAYISHHIIGETYNWSYFSVMQA